MSKHTPGPWRVGRPGPNGCQTIGTHGGLMVAMVAHSLNDPPPHREQAIGNASLLAAAPDLLEALRGLVNALEMEPGPRGVMDLVPGAIEKARAAIARAEGRS